MKALCRGAGAPLLFAAAMLAACSDSTETNVTSVERASLEAEQAGTPVSSSLASSLTFTSPTARVLVAGGPRVGVLAYCMDLTGGVGAENVANTLIADGRFGAVTVVDGDASAPTAQDLLASYDAVIAMTDNRCGNGSAAQLQAGDAAAAALTGFAQGGGGVVLATFGFSLPAGIGFGAAIYADGLSPFQPVQIGNALAGGMDIAGASGATACLELLEGVTSPVSSTYANEVTVSTGATLCASYSNGRPVLAINALGNIVALNSFPATASDNTQAAYRQLVGNAVFAVSGDLQTTETIENGEAATVTVAEDSDGDGDVEQVAGADFPANAFENDPNDPDDDVITVSVKLRKVEPGDASCHAYLVGQVGRCMEVTATKQDGSDAKLTQPIRVGVCLDVSRALDIYKFESAEDAPKQLEQTDVTDFLDCTGFQLSSARPKNWIEGLAARIGKWITPKSAYAADRGMGGFVDDEHLSFFTWAAPMQLTSAALVVNVRGSGKDAFQVTGVFDLVTTKGFEPAAGESGFDPALAIPVRYGAHTFTVPAGALRWSAFLKRWVYSSLTATGVTAFAIDPLSGRFTVAGLVPTEGDSPPAFRAFTIQLGNRMTGAGLLCGAGTAYSCSYEQH